MLKKNLKKGHKYRWMIKIFNFINIVVMTMPVGSKGNGCICFLCLTKINGDYNDLLKHQQIHSDINDTLKLDLALKYSQREEYKIHIRKPVMEAISACTGQGTQFQFGHMIAYLNKNYSVAIDHGKRQKEKADREWKQRRQGELSHEKSQHHG